MNCPKCGGTLFYLSVIRSHVYRCLTCGSDFVWEEDFTLRELERKEEKS